MARRRLPIPSLKDRLETAAMVYAAAKEDLGEADPDAVKALDMLKECAEHLYENQHPDPVDENGDPQPKPESPIQYAKIFKRLERSQAADAAKVAYGASTTITPGRV